MQNQMETGHFSSNLGKNFKDCFDKAQCSRFISQETLWRVMFPDGRTDWLAAMQYHKAAKKSRSKTNKETVIWDFLMDFFISNGILTTEQERKTGIFKRNNNVLSSIQEGKVLHYYFKEEFDAQACLQACKLLHKKEKEEKKPEEKDGRIKNTNDPFSLKQCQGESWKKMEDSIKRLGCKGYKWF